MTSNLSNMMESMEEGGEDEQSLLQDYIEDQEGVIEIDLNEADEELDGNFDYVDPTAKEKQQDNE